MRIVCISDTHLAHEKAKIKVPDGNISIPAGDGTIYEGIVSENTDFNRWRANFHYRHKVMVAGNHDFPE